jgi:hypothetical protein
MVLPNSVRVDALGVHVGSEEASLESNITVLIAELSNDILHLCEM